MVLTLLTRCGVKKSPKILHPHTYNWLSLDKAPENDPALTLTMLIIESSFKIVGTLT